jgi:hypothetical protein
VEHASHLLQMLLTLLAVNGVAPEAADPWRGWMTFKQYVRIVDEVPDPGVSVQVLRHRDHSTSLVLLRQVLDQEGDWLQPVGGVVVKFNYPSDTGDAEGPEWEFWSFDHCTFERFVDCVEQHEEFAYLMLQSPRRTWVTWLDA